jgi:threo-3-hydroxy-L-aspartate ammonia-lyase
LEFPHANGAGAAGVVARVPASAAISFDDVRAAAARLDGIAHRTPVVRSRALDERSGALVYVKCENLQRMGAFKFRGAYNFLASLSDEQRRKGVVAFSSGNHAQGVALAAKLFDVPAVIVMPTDAPAVKVDATREYGAEIIFYDRDNNDREALANRIANERGATAVPPFDDPRIMAGAATTTLELVEECELDAIVTPVGGGGLLSGGCIAAHGLDPAIEMYGVEPEAGDDFVRSMKEQRRVSIAVPRTVADGLRTTAPGELTFEIVRTHAREVVTVSDDALLRAMRFAFERMKMVIEPSGAAGIAALLERRISGLAGKRVGVIISGGNVDAATFCEAISR